MALGSEYASGSEQRTSYSGSPVEDEAPARAHFGGRHVDSEASIGLRDNEKQTH